MSGQGPVDPALREAVVALAQRAAAAILEVYGTGFEVERKSDASPLTEADLASHRLIADGLARLTPGVPVLSEEAADIPWDTRRHWRRFWLVDPLDGTREFVKRNGEFTVNIALIEDGVAVFGVVQAPVSGVVWHGVLGGGAFRREGAGSEPPAAAAAGGQDAGAGAGEVRLRVRTPATGRLRVAASRSHRDARTEALLARMGDHETLGLGSSLKFCRIAEGELDVYPRFGPTSEWDTAAGQCVLEAAGGAVLAPDGRPFRYNQRETLLNGDFIALGDTGLPWRDWLPPAPE